MVTTPGAITLEDLIDELARVLHEGESARMLVLRARFPAADLPVFDVPRVFWSRVIRAAVDGKLVGGVRALVDEVAKQYPGNRVFAGCRGEIVPGGSEGAAASDFAAAKVSSTQHATSGGMQAAGTSATAVDGYDVFLSHSSADGAAVEEIAARLRDEAGLRVFLDTWALVPREPWMPAIERAIERSTTVAVFFGLQGRGAWHDQESQLALVAAAEGQGKRVIPVLLPGARKEDVGGFMRLRMWVELGLGGGFERLVAGVRGRALGSGGGSSRVGSERSPAEASPQPVGQERAGIGSERARVLLPRTLTDCNRRWWLLPGEVAARLGTADLVFESDDGALWSFSLRTGGRVRQIHWDHQARGFVARGLEEVGSDTAATLRTLLHTMIGHSHRWILQGAAKHVVDTIAQAMLDDEWITGRRLRVLLEMQKTDFLPIAEELQPRYLRAREGDNGDGYSLTLPGLWFSSQAPRVRRILEAIIATLKGKFRADPDVRSYSLDEVVESGGFDDVDRSLIVTLVSLTGLMYGGQGVRSAGRLDHQWGVPREIEDIVGLSSVDDLFRFFRRYPDRFTSVRCWPTAPIGPLVE